MRIIPRLDIKGENLIKGVHLEGLRVLGKPNEFAKQYFLQGADELLYMDSVASLYGRNNLSKIIEEATKDIFIPITVGGGIRTKEDVKRILKCGADKVALNTAVVNNVDLIDDLIKVFGSSTITASIEAKKKATNNWEVYIHNGKENTRLDVVDWVRKITKHKVGEILITSIDKEGTRKGFDFELLKIVQKNTDLPIIACGGMGSPEDMIKAFLDCKVDAVSMADILHYKRSNIKDLKFFANKSKIKVRL